MRNTFAGLLLLTLFACQKKQNLDLTTTFEASKGIETATYQEVIDYYLLLSREYPEINIQDIGETDSGFPLHLVTYNPNGNFNFDEIRKNKTIVLVNNGIHPGESDGIDATMMLFRDLAQNKTETLENTVISTIPVYNIGGSLNRNSDTRTNQNGPKAYGFRGNARNYDLNRDFIKNDTKNANAFARIFHLVQPDIFIDNHVSNGADYQYVLTHLFTQHNKLGGELGNYLHTRMMPTLEKSLKDAKWDITPYVNVFNSVPEKGFSQFMDHPRYSTGYTTLWNTLGMMVETHMLKPYKKRVEGTYVLMQKMLDIAEKDRKKIKQLRKNAFEQFQTKKEYTLQWELDTTKTSTLHFKGFEGKMILSEVTGQQRLKYNRSKPFTKEVTYKNYMKPKVTIEVPNAYIIPKGWHKVVSLLALNNISFKTFEKDTLITVEAYKIEDYKTRPNPYEGHYLHSNTKVSKVIKKMQFFKGDIFVSTQQNGVRYLLETLEPQAQDSFFNWNFFDTVLQQKEGFSPYVFEDVALKMLQTDAKLKAEFDSKKENDERFANNWYAQLDWLHKKSHHYEKAHMQYPVYRVLKK